jgi:hypothetical protein
VQRVFAPRLPRGTLLAPKCSGCGDRSPERKGARAKSGCARGEFARWIASHHTGIRLRQQGIQRQDRGGRTGGPHIAADKVFWSPAGGNCQNKAAQKGDGKVALWVLRHR